MTGVKDKVVAMASKIGGKAVAMASKIGGVVVQAVRGPGGTHFLVAAGILLVTAVGWNVAMAWWKVTLAKKPVPPPEHVRVEDFRLVNFPEKLGPYVRDPDWLIKIPKDILGTLGTKSHHMNWYYMSKYRLPDPAAAGGTAHIGLDVTYYTGLLDAVPHIPEVCLQASGAILDREDRVTLTMNVPDAPAAWREIQVRRVAFITKGQKLYQYYFFSMNGRPTADWKIVRAKLMHPLVRYCYFAKVQVTPTLPGVEASVSDEACRDFLKYALPEVLRFLPTADDVKKLET